MSPAVSTREEGARSADTGGGGQTFLVSPYFEVPEGVLVQGVLLRNADVRGGRHGGVAVIVRRSTRG